MRLRSVLVLCVLATLLASSLTCTLRTEQGGLIPSQPGGSGSTSLNNSAAYHKLMVSIEIADLRNENATDIVTSTFHAFLYGHPLSEESVVSELRASGLEDWRYFNVFAIDPRYPEWQGFYAELYERIEAIEGTIPDVHYRYFGSPLGPDRIIDHTRPEVTEVVFQTVSRWAGLIGAGRRYLDLAFEELQDWMILDGEEWPWSPEELARRNVIWRENMQSLVDRCAREQMTGINATYELHAPVVMFENQPLVHLSNRYTWQELVERIVAREVIPILHVGHQHIHTPQLRIQSEAVTAAVWLLAEQAYLNVEFDFVPLAFAGRLKEQGFDRFVADGPAEEVSPGLWRRTGTVDGAPWTVEVNTAVPYGRMIPGSP